jgi:hypothetical protein
MRRKSHLAGVRSMLLFAATVLLLTTFAASVGMAQRQPAREPDGGLLRQPRTTEREIVTTPQQAAIAPKPTPLAKGLPGMSEDQKAVIPSYNVPAVMAAGPVSRCTPNNPNAGFTCKFAGAGGTGNPSVVSNGLSTPLSVNGGYVVLKKDPAVADSVVANWTTVLKFGDGSAASTTSAQLLSAGCNGANTNDRSCFPTYAEAAANAVFMAETAPISNFKAGSNVYLLVANNPPVRPFTLASSTGTVDEDSTSIVQFRNFTALLLPGAIGSVHLRYNISAVDGVSFFCPATQSTVRVRFRNSDDSGATARVTFEIHSSSVTSGGNILLYTFDSNGRGAGGSFTTATDTPAIDFDFTNNAYWIEATIFRSDPGQLAELGSVQIWESNGGSSCP